MEPWSGTTVWEMQIVARAAQVERMVGRARCMVFGAGLRKRAVNASDQADFITDAHRTQYLLLRRGSGSRNGGGNHFAHVSAQHLHLYAGGYRLRLDCADQCLVEKSTTRTESLFGIEEERRRRTLGDGRLCVIEKLPLWRKFFDGLPLHR